MDQFFLSNGSQKCVCPPPILPWCGPSNVPPGPCTAPLLVPSLQPCPSDASSTLESPRHFSNAYVLTPPLWLMSCDLPSPLPSNSGSSSASVMANRAPNDLASLSLSNSISLSLCLPIHAPALPDVLGLFFRPVPFPLPGLPFCSQCTGEICTRPSRFDATLTPSLISRGLTLPRLRSWGEPSSKNTAPCEQLSHSRSTSRCSVTQASLCMSLPSGRQFLKVRGLACIPVGYLACDECSARLLHA